MSTIGVRPARPEDAEAMVALAEEKRLELQTFQPQFWHKAADSRDRHLGHVSRLIGSDRAITLVYDAGGAIDGFLVATLITPPPVYDPGGLTCIIDDFIIGAAADWGSVGRALLRVATADAKGRGATQVVIVCAHLDEPKRAMLRDGGYSIASEWYVSGI